MESFIEQNNLLSSFQYGFRKALSAQHAILDIVSAIQTNMEGVKFPGVVAVLCVVPSGLVLHIGITSCTFPPWTEMSQKNNYENGQTLILVWSFY